MMHDTRCVYILGPKPKTQYYAKQRIYYRVYDYGRERERERERAREREGERERMRE